MLVIHFHITFITIIIVLLHQSCKNCSYFASPNCVCACVSAALHYVIPICDMIKGNELDVANMVLGILAKQKVKSVADCS